MIVTTDSTGRSDIFHGGIDNGGPHPRPLHPPQFLRRRRRVRSCRDPRAEALARDLTHIRQTGLAEGKSGALATSLVDDQANPIGAVTLCPGEAQGTMRDGLAQALIATARRLAVAIGEANMSSLDDWRYDED